MITALPDIMTQAQAQFSDGDLMSAEKTLRDGQKLFPDVADIPRILGDIRLAQGRMKKAADDYRSAIELAHKDEAETAFLFASLANALTSADDIPGAVLALVQATQLDPNNPALHNNLGLLQRRIGQGTQAVASLQQATALAPENALYHSNLGRVLQDIGDLEPARKAVEKSLTLDPESADALVNLGCIMRDLKRPFDAITALEKACQVAPYMVEASLNLGLAYRDTGQADKAIDLYQDIVTQYPDHADILANLGRALHDKCRFDESEQAFNNALSIRQDDPSILNNLASMYVDADRPGDAKPLFERALALQPDNVSTLSNLADLMCRTGHQAQALDLNAAASSLDPDNRKIQRNRADSLFLSGNLVDGWAAYDKRWHDNLRPRRPFDYPDWQGESLSGKTILVSSEQGVGDTLLFASCLPDLIERAGQVIMELDARLVPLFARSFPQAQFITRDTPPDPAIADLDIQVQCPAGDMGRWLRRSLDDFPAQPAFIRAAPDRVQYWRHWLSTLPAGKKLGLFWSSGLMDAERWCHYPTLADWTPIFQRSDIQFINLQYGDHDPALADLKSRFPCGVHVPPAIDLFNDLDDIAALTTALDGLVSPESTNAWMAGAVGVPASVMCQPHDWRTFGTATLPWFPSVQMIEKPIGEAWSGTTARVAGLI